ncbi:hypothetical protein L3Q82_009329 [Scortum barcoo]|uniref:Uncharacterized protein n=1 Tax=Scortum barcoo TaxID=214431 RepID=A0ACB8WG24_9TELE|nr:hypothetical protein L3Q82_009329 [Scortum barcoo]
MFSASIVESRQFKVVDARSLVPVVVATPETQWWTPEVRDAVIRLKKESYQTMLACGTPDAVDRYRQAKQASAARTVLEAKTRVWEEFGEAMPWRRTIGRPRREAVLCQHCLQCGWGAVDLNWGHCRTGGRNNLRISSIPSDLPSNEEAEAGDSEVDSSITQAEVTEVVHKLLGGKAPGVDEIRPEYLKSLDVVGLSWLTRLCNIAWSLPGKVSRQGTGEENSADSRPSDSGRKMWFLSLVVGTLDQLYTLHAGCLRVYGSLPNQSTCALWNLEKAFDRVPRGILWGVLTVWGPGAFAKGCSVSVRPEQELGSHCRQTFSMYWSGLQPSVKQAGMRISTSKSEAMVLDRKRVACPLRVGGEILPQVEEFKYLGVLFTSEGKMEREIDRRIGAASAVIMRCWCTEPL